ncbi:MAG: Rpn family recombination-promoting nuclease/putative transposase [Planctomycetaceae bacterium]|jgi:hypothetical protein|nr:Rpn family recombination-promoting nuclease/putative transposase [Planctomycetaceae bacterium]
MAHENSQTNAESSQSEKRRPGNIYDVFVKNIFSMVYVFCDFLVHYGDQNFVRNIDLSNISLSATHYIGELFDERILDLVFLCPLKNGSTAKAVIFFEHIGDNIATLPVRLHSFASAFWWRENKEGKKTLSSIYFIILRAHKTPLPLPYPQILDRLPKDENGEPIGYAPEIHYTIVDLSSLPMSELRGEEPLSRFAMGILKKMTEGAEEEFGEAMLPLMELEDEEQQAIITKETFRFISKVFAARGKRLDPQTLNDAIKPIFKERTDTVMLTIFEEVEARGEARGKTEFGRNMVLSVLRKRFGAIPDDIETSIRQMNDPIALESLVIEAAICGTLEEFSSIVNA